MFQFPEFPSTGLYIHPVIQRHYSLWVAPFGYLRVDGYLLLTAAFRSLSRPSSAPSAKASALCSYSLNLQLVNRFSCVVAVALSLACVPLVRARRLLRDAPSRLTIYCADLVLPNTEFDVGI